MLSPYIIAAVARMVLVHLLIKKDGNWVQEIPQLSVSYAHFDLYVDVALDCLFGVTDSAPFIYFHF